MGAAAAALLQDDAIVRALYEAEDPEFILGAIDARLGAVRVLPRTSRPTKKSLAAREKRMLDELSDLKQRLVDAEEALGEDGCCCEAPRPACGACAATGCCATYEACVVRRGVRQASPEARPTRVEGAPRGALDARALDAQALDAQALDARRGSPA